MKILLTLFSSETQQKNLSSSAWFDPAFVRTPWTVRVPDTHDLFDRVLTHLGHSGGALLRAETVFTTKEIESVRWFQVRGRRRISQSEEDFERTRAHLRALAFARRRPRPGGCIKLLDKVWLTKQSLPTDAVAVAGTFSYEFVARSEMFELVRDEGLRGVEARPVVSPRSPTPSSSLFLLYAPHVLPDAIYDQTTPIVPGPDEESCGRRQLGCLTYGSDDLEGAPDFARTSEDWAANYGAALIVSSRARSVLRRHRIRGANFHPVLEHGTPLWNEYIARWETMLGKIRLFPAHFA